MAALEALDRDLATFAAAQKFPLTGSAKKRKIVATTFNAIGIVVPYDAKQDVGYRPLPLGNRTLEKDAKLNVLSLSLSLSLPLFFFFFFFFFQCPVASL